MRKEKICWRRSYASPMTHTDWKAFEQKLTDTYGKMSNHTRQILWNSNLFTQEDARKALTTGRLSVHSTRGLGKKSLTEIRLWCGPLDDKTGHVFKLMGLVHELIEAGEALTLSRSHENLQAWTNVVCCAKRGVELAALAPKK